MQGVRISLPVDMFKKKQVDAFIEKNYGVTKGYIGPLSKEETFTDDYIVMNVFDAPRSFFKKIVYDNEYPLFYSGLFEKDEKSIFISSMFELGGYKHKRWAFQNESRFLLYVNPLLPMNHILVNGSKYQQMQLASYCLNKGLPNRVNYIDVDLDEVKLTNIGITLGLFVQ